MDGPANGAGNLQPKNEAALAIRTFALWAAVPAGFSPVSKNLRLRLISRWGRVAIKAAEWGFDYAQRAKPMDSRRSATLRWSRHLARDRASVVEPKAGTGTGEYRDVVADGLTDRPLMMTVEVPPNDSNGIHAIRMFRPVLPGSSFVIVVSAPDWTDLAVYS